MCLRSFILGIYKVVVIKNQGVPKLKDIKPNGNLTMDKLRNIQIHWGKNALRINYDSETGYFETAQDNRVEIVRLLQDTIKYQLYNLETEEIQSVTEDYFNQFKIDISYNCFGYCFGDSECWITNPEQIIHDEYEEVHPDEAEIIVFLEYVGINDNGQNQFQYSHAVKLNEDRTVSFKPGINKLVENVKQIEAIHTYNYNRELYLKKRKQIATNK